MLLLSTNTLVRRLAVITWACAVSITGLLQNQCHAQGVVWSGVNEGSAIQLLPGMATTNLSITASPTAPFSPTNLVFVLERQGKVVLTRTVPPPYALTFTNLSPGKYFLAATLEAPSLSTLGDLSFDISPVAVRPPNDDWSQATLLSTLDNVAIASNLHATRQDNEPTPSGSGAGKTIWWAWKASATSVFTATTAGSNFDTLLGVYVGTNVATLTSIASNDDIGPNAFSQVTFSATNGVTYYFLVDSATPSVGGQAQLRLFAGEPPSIAITAPPDGALMLVASSMQSTNVNATIKVSDSGGIARVDYWFDGGTNFSRSGSLVPPYQLSLTNLFEGHYILTVAASNNVGLVNCANVGLSIISLEPALVVDRSGSVQGKFQMGLTGFKGPNYTLQASTNLDVWCGVNTWTNFAGAVKVTDTNAAQLQRRFYRAISAQ